MIVTNTDTGEMFTLTPANKNTRRTYSTARSTWLQRFLAKESGRLTAVGLICFLFGLGF